jgi:hypothetical protein
MRRTEADVEDGAGSRTTVARRLELGFRAQFASAAGATDPPRAKRRGQERGQGRRWKILAALWDQIEPHEGLRRFGGMRVYI